MPNRGIIGAFQYIPLALDLPPTTTLTVSTRTLYLDALLALDQEGRTRYNHLKRIPKRASYSHLDDWLIHLQWLDSLGDFRPHLEGIPLLKLQHFAAEAKPLDASEMADLHTPHRLTVLAALITHAQAKARDGLVELFRKRMAAFHKMARARLEQLQLAHQEEIDRLIATFSDVLDVLDEASAAQEALQRISHILAPSDGPQQLIASCDAIRAYSSNNHLGLVWEFYHTHLAICGPRKIRGKPREIRVTSAGWTGSYDTGSSAGSVITTLAAGC